LIRILQRPSRHDFINPAVPFFLSSPGPVVCSPSRARTSSHLPPSLLATMVGIRPQPTASASPVSASSLKSASSPAVDKFMRPITLEFEKSTPIAGRGDFVFFHPLTLGPFVVCVFLQPSGTFGMSVYEEGEQVELHRDRRFAGQPWAKLARVGLSREDLTAALRCLTQYRD